MRYVFALLLLATAGCGSSDTTALERRIADLEAKLAARHIECDSVTVGNVLISPKGIIVRSPECQSVVEARGLGVTVGTEVEHNVLACQYRPELGGATLRMAANGDVEPPAIILEAHPERARIELGGGAATRHGINIAATANNTAFVQMRDGQASTIWAVAVAPDGKLLIGVPAEGTK